MPGRLAAFCITCQGAAWGASLAGMHPPTAGPGESPEALQPSSSLPLQLMHSQTLVIAAGAGARPSAPKPAPSIERQVAWPAGAVIRHHELPGDIQGV